MIRSLLLAAFLIPALPYGAGADALPGPVTQAAMAYAEHDWKANALRPLSVAFGETRPDGARSVAVLVDRAALFAELPTLQEHGVLSKSITGDALEKRPASYSNALALLLTSYAVRDLYDAHLDLGATRWKVLLSPSPGNMAQDRREMFAFTFDRPRYESIDWDRLAFTEFPHVAGAFSYNLRFTLEMSHELDGSIAED